jgi:hypothetical protein
MVSCPQPASTEFGGVHSSGYTRFKSEPVAIAQTKDSGQQCSRRCKSFFSLGEQLRIFGVCRMDQSKTTVEFPANDDHQIVIRPGTEHTKFLRIG